MADLSPEILLVLGNSCAALGEKLVTERRELKRKQGGTRFTVPLVLHVCRLAHPPRD